MWQRYRASEEGKAMTDYGGTQLRGRLIDCFVAPEHLDTRDQSRCQVVPNSWAQENSQQGIWKTSHCTASCPAEQ